MSGATSRTTLSGRDRNAQVKAPGIDGRERGGNSRSTLNQLLATRVTTLPPEEPAEECLLLLIREDRMVAVSANDRLGSIPPPRETVPRPGFP